MPIRPARLDDIPQMHRIRLAVRENVLTDHARVMPDDYRAMLETRGRGWVEERDGEIVAFAIADQTSRNIWALFVAPDVQSQGVGRALLGALVEWMTRQGGDPIWLTEPGTRAERFYREAGWRAVGTTSAGEIRFEFQPEPQTN